MADPVYGVQQYDACVQSFIMIHGHRDRVGKNLLILLQNIYTYFIESKMSPPNLILALQGCTNIFNHN